MLNDIRNNPQACFVGVCVFFVAIMGTSVNHVASTAFALLFISSFFVIKDWKVTWKSLSNNEKLLLTGFGLYALSGLIAYINVHDTHEYIKSLGRYMRFLAAVPVYLFVKKYKVNVIKYLYAGAIVSGPFLFAIAFSDYLKNPDLPAHGDYHHIIFGGVAMLNVGIMLSVLLTVKLKNFEKTIISMAMFCGFIAAVLSQSRGVWLALPMYLLITIYYALRYSKISIRSVVMVIILITGILVLSPVGEMVKKRVDAAVDEVSSFYSKDQYISSLGTRLAMWDIAIDVWKQHPVIGTGPGDFDDVIRDLQKNGKYVGMGVYNSTHNIYFQSLVNAGAVGFIIMMFAIFIVPLKVIMGGAAKQSTASLSGLILVLFFAIFGLGESWTLRSSTILVYIVYLIILVSNISTLNNKYENS